MTATTQAYPRRHGFTLIELIVVLMILVGLAGILIPAVTDMVHRTNTSTASANISEVSNALQRYETQYLVYPNNMDGLMTDLVGANLDTLDSGFTAATADVTLTALTRVPLTNAGITSVGIHTVGDTTFDLPAATALTDTAIISGPTAAAQVALGLETTGVADKYVCFGIGQLCDMNGKTVMDAPVYFPESSSVNPETAYARFVAVFQITDGTNALTRAKLVAVMTPTGESIGDNMSEYFDLVTNN